MESVFHVIAEPNRRAILGLLVASERTVGELEAQLDMSQPTVSKHLRVLREAGVVEATLLALAGLKRLGLGHVGTPVPEDEMLPAVGQGAVCIECRSDDTSTCALLAAINHATASAAADRLAQVPGVYVPSLYGPGPDGVTLVPLEPGIPARVLRRTATPMPHYAMGLVPHIETVHDRLTVEIRRGCTRGCRFCQPGMLTRPARDVEPEAVIEAIETGMERTGYSDFSLLSLSCSDYLALPAVGVELRNRLADKNVTLTLPSQRVDRFDANIAHILGGTRKAGLTFAPEAGSQRLRDIVNKGLTDAELLRGIRTAMESGYRKVKLYFMIGLPGETDADVIGIAE